MPPNYHLEDRQKTQEILAQGQPFPASLALHKRTPTTVILTLFSYTDSREHKTNGYRRRRGIYMQHPHHHAHQVCIPFKG